MVASAPILGTKLYIPPPPPKVVVRTRLIERLDEGLAAGGKLTLISAPAGFGKTTLVSEWVHQKEEDRRRRDESGNPPHPPSLILQPSKVAWLSLDEGDSDPTRFLSYLVAALRTITPELGEGVLGSLQAPPPPPTESILTALLNEITTIPDPFLLVLDDYHVIDSRSIDDALTFLVEHLPPQMHLVITTREDPALPIPRLRARRQLTELRAADLRFTPSEAAEFLSQVMGLRLSAEDLAVLDDRTEGWIAGLQLAALSMQGRQDVHGFIRAFAGDNRYVVDYLIEEVLQRQPEAVRSFLLQTSIFDRLNGPLCDAVIGNHPAGTEQKGSSALLESLQRGNFFLIPLDDKRHWYRYHHLFADVLRMHLLAEQPDQVPSLHRRASAWYEENGSADDAIRHALAAKDFERAADLIEQALPEMGRTRQGATLLGWLRSLPDELIRARPVLNVAYAHLLLDGGEVDGVEDRLRDAEEWLDTAADNRARAGAPAGNQPEPFPQGRFAVDDTQDLRRSRRMVVVDHEAFRRLPGAIAIARAGLSLARGDVPGAMTYARQALDVAPEDDHLTRGGAAGFLGLAFWTSGDLEAAHRMFADGMASLHKAGNISDAIYGATTLAAIRITQGRLHEAMSVYERALQLAAGQGALVPRGTADMHVGMSEIQRERNDLHAATQHLLKSQELGEHTGFPQNRYRWRVAMARIRQARGDLDGALDLLHEAERLYLSDFSPNVRPIEALVTRVWLAQGRLGEAFSWARERGLSAEDDLSYLREFEHITLARLLLAQYEKSHDDRFLSDATRLLERLRNAAEEGGRMGSAIEILVLQTLAHQLQGNVPAALLPLERALTLVEPEGYIRMFLDEGPPMAGLLREAARRGILPDYTGKLLEAFEAEEQKSVGESLFLSPPASQALIEPLSQRELEVLRLFRTELSGPEIARELVIGLSTVRSHTKSLYNKLNVNNRRAAVRRAEELGLI